MKRRISFLTAVFLGMCIPTFAGQNFVDQFLNRYKPPALSLPRNIESLTCSGPTKNSKCGR